MKKGAMRTENRKTKERDSSKKKWGENKEKEIKGKGDSSK